LAPISTALRTHRLSAIRAEVFPQGKCCPLRRDVPEAAGRHQQWRSTGIDSAVSALRHKVDKALNPAKKGGNVRMADSTAPALTSASDEDPDKLIAALDRNTAALLTVATLIVRAASGTTSNEETSQFVKKLVSSTFQSFVQTNRM